MDNPLDPTEKQPNLLSHRLLTKRWVIIVACTIVVLLIIIAIIIQQLAMQPSKSDFASAKRVLATFKSTDEYNTTYQKYYKAITSDDSKLDETNRLQSDFDAAAYKRSDAVYKLGQTKAIHDHEVKTKYDQLVKDFLYADDFDRSAILVSKVSKECTGVFGADTYYRQVNTLTVAGFKDFAAKQDAKLCLDDVQQLSQADEQVFKTFAEGVKSSITKRQSLISNLYNSKIKVTEYADQLKEITSEFVSVSDTYVKDRPAATKKITFKDSYEKMQQLLESKSK